jgi:hypothetical protein
VGKNRRKNGHTLMMKNCSIGYLFYGMEDTAPVLYGEESLTFFTLLKVHFIAHIHNGGGGGGGLQGGLKNQV